MKRFTVVLLFLLAFSSFALVLPTELQVQEAHAVSEPLTTATSAQTVTKTQDCTVVKQPCFTPTYKFGLDGSVHVWNNYGDNVSLFPAITGFTAPKLEFNSSYFGFSKTFFGCTITNYFKNPTATSLTHKVGWSGCPLGSWALNLNNLKGFSITVEKSCIIRFSTIAYDLCDPIVSGGSISWVGNKIRITVTASSGFIDPSIVQTNSAYCASACTSRTAAFSSNVVSGNLLLVGVAVYSSAASCGTLSVSDTRSSTWTSIVSACNTVGGAERKAQIFKASAASSGANTVTVESTQGESAFEVDIIEASGYSTTAAGSASGTGNAATSATTSYSFASGSLLFASAAFFSGSTFGAGTGFTRLSTLNGCQGSEYATSGLTSPTTFPMTCGAAAEYAAAGAEFASPVANTYKYTNTGGGSLTAPTVRYRVDGTYTSATLTTGGASITTDSGSVVYPDALMGGGTSTEQGSATPITYGLVGYWPLDENIQVSAYDLSDNENTGTLTNTPTWVAGKFGNALSFASASNQFVDMGAPSTLNPASGGFTASAWVQVSSFSASSAYILAKGGFTNPGYDVLLATDKTLRAEFDDASLRSICSGVTTFLSGTWYMVTIVHPANGGINVYLNAVSECSDATVLGAINPTQNFFVSRYPFGTEQTWNGLIDDVRIYNRALTASEITELYNSSPANLENAPTSGSQTFNLQFYHQYDVAAKYSVISGSPSNFVLTFSNVGASTTMTLTQTAANNWMDATAYTSAPQYVTSSERYSSSNASISSATLTLGRYRQFLVTNTNSISISPTQYGAVASAVTTNAFNDNNGALSVAAIYTCSYTIKNASYVYQFSPSGTQVLTNASISSVSDFSTSSPPYLTFVGTKIHAIMCIKASNLVTPPDRVTDAGAAISSTWVSPLLTFAGGGTSVTYEVDFIATGPSNPGGGGGGGGGGTTVISTTTTTTISGPPFPVSGNEALIAPGLGILTFILIGLAGFAYAKDRRDIRGATGTGKNFTLGGGRRKWFTVRIRTGKQVTRKTKRTF